jgi:hypothetical protein
MKRLMVTIAADGIFIQELHPQCLDMLKQKEWADKNWSPARQLGQAADLLPMLKVAQEEVAAAHAVNNVASFEPEPPRAA